MTRSLCHIAGEIVDATAALDDEKAWLFLTLNHHGRLRNLSFTYDRTGTFLASVRGRAGRWRLVGHNPREVRDQRPALRGDRRRD